MLLPTQSLSPRQPTVHMLELLQYSPVGHWLSSVHATQVLVVMSQKGVVPPQSLSWVHRTQIAVLLLLAPLQIGVAPEHVVPVLPQTHL